MSKRKKGRRERGIAILYTHAWFGNGEICRFVGKRRKERKAEFYAETARKKTERRHGEGEILKLLMGWHARVEWGAVWRVKTTRRWKRK